MTAFQSVASHLPERERENRSTACGCQPDYLSATARISDKLLRDRSLLTIVKDRYEQTGKTQREQSCTPDKDIRVFHLYLQILSHPCYLTQDRIKITLI